MEYDVVQYEYQWLLLHDVTLATAGIAIPRCLSGDYFPANNNCLESAETALVLSQLSD